MQTITLGLALFLVCLCNIAGAALTVTSLFPTGGNNQVATFVVTLTPAPTNLNTPKVKITDQVGTTAAVTLGTVGFTLVNGVAKATVTKTYPTGPTFTVGSVDHKIVASYPGQTNANFVHKLYNGKSQTVLTSNKLTYAIGETITLTATVTKVTGQGTFTLPATGIAFQHNGVAFTCKALTKIANGWTCTYLIPATEKTGSHKFTAIFQGIPAQKYGGSSGDKTVTIGCTATVLDCNNDKVCETNINTDANHCGSCTTVCDLPNTNANTCVNKVCTVGTCDLGFGNCNTTNPGCEPLNTLTDCGSCGQACALPHATSTCANGTCSVTTCDAGFKDCTVAPGCETATNTYENCGNCGVTCDLRAFPHAVASCKTGTCAVDTCDAGWKSCDANPDCETHTETDLTHCGDCNTACPTTANGLATCVNGACGLTCNSGFKNCDANPDCETNINVNVNNCGDCGTVCNLANTAVHTCNNGLCQVDTCDLNFGDCDCKIAGCETSLITVTNCGSCGNVCALPNAVSTCVTGTCDFSSCNAGFLSCNAEPGCETDINNDVNNCGACGHVCSSAQGTATCNSGVCSISCDAGFQDCDVSSNNGCELNCSTSTPTITYGTTLAIFPADKRCDTALTALGAGGIPRFGTGNFNRNWVKATRDGIEIGLRAEERRVLDITPAFNNIYETIACPSYGTDSELDNGGEARWNYGISVNLQGATGSLAGTTLGDFDVKLKIEPVGETLSAFPIEIDVKDYLGGNLLQEICEACHPSLPFDIGSQHFTGADCTDFYSSPTNKQRAVNALNILQDSSNLNFYAPTFPFLETHEYKVSLTLTHKTSCVCPLEVEMIVLVGYPSPDPTKCPLLTCDQPGQIECDQDGKDGCETNSFSLPNCGSCGNVCAPANTPDASCAAGACTFTTCNTNYASCDNIITNGCEYAQNTVSTAVSNINIPQFVITATCSDASTKLGLGLLPRVGSGNVDGAWVTSQVDGIIIGLRAEERGQGTYPVSTVTDQDGIHYVYQSYACKAYSSKVTDTIKRARWNYGFSVDLSGFTGGGSLTLNDFDSKITITAQTPIPTGDGDATQSTVELDVKNFGPGILGDVYGLSNPPNAHCLSFPFTVNGQPFATIEDLTAVPGGATDKLKLIQESTNVAFAPQFPFAATYNTENVWDITLTLTSKVPCAPQSLSVSIRVNVVADPGNSCDGGDTCCNLCNTCG